MNDYFVNIGVALNSSNNSIWQPHQYFLSQNPNSFTLTVISTELMSKYIKSMNIGKPSGIQFLNNKVLRDALSCIPFELVALMNNCIINEIFPREWKHGVITPIPKAGNVKNKGNWGPITILNCIGKLLEY